MVNRNINYPAEKCLDCWIYRKVRGVWVCPYGLRPVFLPTDKEGQLRCECFGFTVKQKDGKPIEEPAPAMRALKKEALRIVGKPTEK